jgi:lipoprotein-releasing system permease protein
MTAIYFIQHQWKVIGLDPESYYLDFVPLRADMPTWFLTNLGALTIAFLLLWISAMLLSRRYTDQNLKFS